MSVDSHKRSAPRNIRLGILTMSSSRSLSEDKSGAWIARQADRAGHEIVYHQVIPDDAKQIIRSVSEVVEDPAPQVLVLTGGTGIGGKDVTIETVRPMFDKEMTAFGPLFAQLSFEQIDSAAILSRATAGVIGKMVLFCLPGSIKACQLACEALIFPELGHLEKHIMEE
jgi:molybdopterin adenylyltransferase